MGRADAMQEAGVRICPIWCAQPDDEHDYEEHVSGPTVLSIADLDTIEVRVATSWFGGDSRLFIRPTVDDDGDFAIGPNDLQTLTQICDELLAQADTFWSDNSSDTRWAYTGAEHEEG